MRKGEILENIKVDKLIFSGNGLGLAPDGMKIIITGGVIPGSIVNLRVLKTKKNYYEAQMLDVVKKSELEQVLPANFQVYGGCKWLPIKYEKQVEIKEEQVREAFYPIKDKLDGVKFHQIISSPQIYGYRNKLEFSWGVYISKSEGIEDNFRFGFHKQGEFSKIINCEYCVLASEEVNKIFKEVDNFSRSSDLPTYDPVIEKGFWRHLVVRATSFTNEIMLVFSVNNEQLRISNYELRIKENEENKSYDLFRKKLSSFIEQLAKKYPNIKSVYVLKNSGKADIVQGEADLIYGVPTIKEKLLGLTFEINPKSFFQTNSYGAELLYSKVIELIGENNDLDIALDLYAGTGTIGSLIASKFKKVYSVEVVKEASEDGKRNAKLNGIKNIEFVNQKTENFLKEFVKLNKKADLIIIDPPRDGMHPDTLPNIINFNSKEIIYVSCNPSTLVRDLKYILENSSYKITDIVPVDMFPHTHHIETIVKLEMRNN